MCVWSEWSKRRMWRGDGEISGEGEPGDRADAGGTLPIPLVDPTALPYPIPTPLARGIATHLHPLSLSFTLLSALLS